LLSRNCYAEALTLTRQAQKPEIDGVFSLARQLLFHAKSRPYICASLGDSIGLPDYKTVHSQNLRYINPAAASPCRAARLTSNLPYVRCRHSGLPAWQGRAHQCNGQVKILPYVSGRPHRAAIGYRGALNHKIRKHTGPQPPTAPCRLGRRPRPKLTLRRRHSGHKPASQGLCLFVSSRLRLPAFRGHNFCTADTLGNGPVWNK